MKREQMYFQIFLIIGILGFGGGCSPQRFVIKRVAPKIKEIIDQKMGTQEDSVDTVSQNAVVPAETNTP